MTASNGLPSSLAVEIAVRREAAMTQLMMLLTERGMLDTAIAEARRRGDLFAAVAPTTPASIPDPYSAGLESVILDAQKGLLG